jgi:hypothetical protein
MLTENLPYLINAKFHFSLNQYSNFPITLGAQGIKPALIKLAIALLLWALLFLIFGRKKKNRPSKTLN